MSLSLSASDMPWNFAMCYFSFLYRNSNRTSLRSSTGSLDLLIEKVLDVTGDRVAIFFQREVAGVEQVKLDVLQVAFVRLGSFSREDRIVLTPHDQCRRLVLTEVCLPLGVPGRVRTVAVEKLQLDLLVSGAIHPILIGRP